MSEVGIYNSKQVVIPLSSSVLSKHTAESKAGWVFILNSNTLLWEK